MYVALLYHLLHSFEILVVILTVINIFFFFPLEANLKQIRME